MENKNNNRKIGVFSFFLLLTFIFVGVQSVMGQTRPYFTITVTVNPEAGGTVTGAGQFYGGLTCHLVATPAEGYYFKNWTENGNIVTLGGPGTPQAGADYTFGVTNSHNFVANFALTSDVVFEVVLYSDPEGAGSLTGGGTDFHYGDWCTLSASANSGYYFVEWINLDSYSPSYTESTFSFPVEYNYYYRAYFTETHYSVDISSNNTSFGTVAYTDNNGNNGEYGDEAYCTLTATPTAGHRFVNWTEGGSQLSTDPTYRFQVTASHTIVGNFISTYTIDASANPSDGGTISGDGVYDDGASCTLTATPNTGYRFVNWTEGGTPVSTNASYTFTVSGNRSLVANFVRTYTVSASGTGGVGTVSGAGVYDEGATCTLTASAGSSYYFVNWTEGGTEVATNSTYTFIVNSDRTLVANFATRRSVVTAVAPD